MLWPFAPRDAMTETLAWKTDVLRPYATEQRIRLSNAPRRTISHDYLFTPAQAELAANIARGELPGPFELPEWQEFSRFSAASGAGSVAVDTTAGRYAVGGKALLWQDWNACESLTISGVSDTTLSFAGTTSRAYGNAVIAPIGTGYLPSGLLTNPRAQTAYAAQAEWECFDVLDLGDDGSLIDSYQGEPLIAAARVGADSFRDRLLREVDAIDNEIARPVYDTARAQAFRSTGVAWITTAAAERWALRVQLHTLKGRSRAFWAPTWNNGIRLAADAVMGATTITVVYAGLSLGSGTGDLFVKRADGSTLALRYTAAVSGGSTETLTLSTGLPSALAVASIQTFCRLLRVRLDSDRVELVHRAPRITSALVPAIEVPL